MVIVQEVVMKYQDNLMEIALTTQIKMPMIPQKMQQYGLYMDQVLNNWMDLVLSSQPTHD